MTKDDFGNVKMIKVVFNMTQKILFFIVLMSSLLSAQDCEIKLDITTDCSIEKTIEPETVTLNNIDVYSYSFKPGKYELEIKHPGYFPLYKQIVILPDNELFLIQEKLITKPRKLTLNIIYYLAPPPNLAPTRIFIAPTDKPDQVQEVKEGDLFKPNSYKLRIEKPAYESTEITQIIWSDERPFSVYQNLYPKSVIIHIDVTHDIPPTPNIPPYQIFIISKRGRSMVWHGRKIVPGSYDFRISQQGYNQFGKYKTIDIEPSEEPYLISEKLIADKRQISFDMPDPDTGLLVEPLSIINIASGKKAEFKDIYEPGVSFTFRIEFEKYQTQQVSTTLPPGEGPHVIYVPMIKLNE